MTTFLGLSSHGWLVATTLNSPESKTFSSLQKILALIWGPVYRWENWVSFKVKLTLEITCSQSWSFNPSLPIPELWTFLFFFKSVFMVNISVQSHGNPCWTEHMRHFHFTNQETECYFFLLRKTETGLCFRDSSGSPEGVLGGSVLPWTPSSFLLVFSPEFGSEQVRVSFPPSNP